MAQQMMQKNDEMEKLTPLLEQKNYEEDDAKLESDDGHFGEDPSFDNVYSTMGEQELADSYENHYDDNEESMDDLEKIMDRSRLPASYFSGHFNTDLLESEKPSLDAACDAYLQGGRFQSEGWAKAWAEYLAKNENNENNSSNSSPTSATSTTTPVLQMQLNSEEGKKHRNQNQLTNPEKNKTKSIGSRTDVNKIDHIYDAPSTAQMRSSSKVRKTLKQYRSYPYEKRSSTFVNKNQQAGQLGQAKDKIRGWNRQLDSFPISGCERTRNDENEESKQKEQ